MELKKKSKKAYGLQEAATTKNYHICNGIVYANGMEYTIVRKQKQRKKNNKTKQTKWNIVFVRSFDSEKSFFLFLKLAKFMRNNI